MVGCRSMHMAARRGRGRGRGRRRPDRLQRSAGQPRVLDRRGGGSREPWELPGRCGGRLRRSLRKGYVAGVPGEGDARTRWRVGGGGRVGRKRRDGQGRQRGGLRRQRGGLGRRQGEGGGRSGLAQECPGGVHGVLLRRHASPRRHHRCAHRGQFDVEARQRSVVRCGHSLLVLVVSTAAGHSWC
jgi:hypothetical protein